MNARPLLCNWRPFYLEQYISLLFLFLPIQPPVLPIDWNRTVIIKSTRPSLLFFSNQRVIYLLIRERGVTMLRTNILILIWRIRMNIFNKYINFRNLLSTENAWVALILSKNNLHLKCHLNRKINFCQIFFLTKQRRRSTHRSSQICTVRYQNR